MYKIDKILIRTHNKGKFKEISDLLPKAIEKISPSELNMESPEEGEKSFLQNSEIKANFFCKKSHLTTLSDDSGLEIDCLAGKPGIFSSRWAKEFGSFNNAMFEILKKINKANQNKKQKNIKAKFVCSLTIQWSDGKKFQKLEK